MSEQENQIIGFIAKVVPFSGVFMTNKTRQRGQMRSVPEDESVGDTEEGDALADMPETLEGTLFHRKGRSAMSSWKRRYVVLHLTDGGSLSCYRFTSKKHYPTRMLRKMYTTLHRRDSILEREKKEGAQSHQTLCFHIPSDVPWIVRDVENDPASFVVEVPASYHQNGINFSEEMHDSDDEDDEDDDEDVSLPDEYSMAVSFATVGGNESAGMGSGRGKKSGSDKKKPLRLYFHCPRKGSEKGLWLRALSGLERLSSESTKKRKLFGSLKHMTRVSRIRSPVSAILARESLQLDSDYRQRTLPYMISTRHLGSHTEVEELAQSQSRNDQAKEYLVQPSYNYPHRWMTHEELRDEMILPSLQFHNLRTQEASGGSGSSDGEIGSLRVEVLQCLGLPKREKAPDVNAVTYLVCGSHAFATDVIPNCANPMWLSKMRRACIFPLFNAYSRFYVGVFDDDGKRQKNDFVGRLALDLSRLRPKSTYDVTIPLRLSTHVYSRRQRGAIRLRFHLEWTNERKALLSYLPKRIRMPRRNEPIDRVTVLCSSPKAFRNVAITVHGAQPPGKFTTSQLKAAIKEFNYTRIAVMTLMRQTLRNTVFWKNPAISLFTFGSWMHCVYSNTFSLVPAYVGSFLLLHLIKNYARYCVELPMQQGFLPPTWEEMFMSLIEKSESQSIAPLDLYMQEASGPRSAPSWLDDDHQNLVVNTHKPRGQGLFRQVGFMECEDHYDGMAVDDNHLEFPFSSGIDYPRFTVKESLDAKDYQASRKSKVLDSKGSRDSSVSYDENGPNHSDSTDNSVAGTSPEEFEFMRVEKSEHDEGLMRSSSLRRSASDQSASGLVDLRSSESPPVGEVSGSLASAGMWRPGHELPNRSMPQQNIDIRYQSQEGDKKITEDLQDIKEKVHELTFNLFNDKAFVVTDNSSPVWGKRRRSDIRKGIYDATKELEKILCVGQYSHSNPVIGRVGLYIEPIVTASMSLLCSFRALFNLFTWQDSFLTFWVSLLFGGTIVVLFVFPWRLFMFVVGVASVGPQNWFLRLFRERRKRRVSGSTIRTQRDPSRQSSLGNPCVDQPVFHGHAPANQPTACGSVSSDGGHHVVVPSSRLMYQRFYDWPPEPQFSRVKSDSTSAVRKSKPNFSRSKLPPAGQLVQFENEGRHPMIHASVSRPPEVYQTWLQSGEQKKFR